MASKQLNFDSLVVAIQNTHDKDALVKLAHQGAEKHEPAHVIRDPYVFEFLGLKQQDLMTERKLEDVLIDKLQDFLLELGHGFCFEARQKKIVIGGVKCTLKWTHLSRPMFLPYLVLYRSN